MDYCKICCMFWLLLSSAALSARATLPFLGAWDPHSHHIPLHYVIYLMPVASSHLSSVITTLWKPSSILLNSPNSFYVFFIYLMVLLHYGAYYRINVIDYFPTRL